MRRSAVIQKARSRVAGLSKRQAIDRLVETIADIAEAAYLSNLKYADLADAVIDCECFGYDGPNLIYLSNVIRTQKPAAFL